MKAEIITIGTELLLGQIVDTNSAWLAEKLAELGIDVYYKAVVGDNKQRVIETLHNSLDRSDLVITTGGLGPTQDDITREAVAEALDQELVKSDSVLEQVKCYFHQSGREMSENNVTQAYFPEEAEIIENPKGTAPAFLVAEDDKIVVSLPGVPGEMKHLMEEKVIPYLQENLFTEQVIHSRVIKTCGIGESDLETEVADIVAQQTNPTIALLADSGEVKIRLTAKAETETEAQKLIEQEEEKLRDRINDYIYGYNEDTLEQVVAEKLWEQDLTLAVAESCTGGLIGDRLTSVPGSSAYFDRGIVSYSNRAKRELLGVKEATLEEFGAVSKQTAREMAVEVKNKAGVDIGLATTGIAGPGGGTEEKPVGLVYLAIAIDEEVQVYQFNFNGTRSRVKYLTSRLALNNLRQKLNQLS